MTHPLNPYAVANYAAVHDITDPRAASAAWAALTTVEREAWRAGADAVLMLADLHRTQPQIAGGTLGRYPSPTEGTPMRLTIGRQVHYTLTGSDAQAIKSGRIGKLGAGQCNEARAGQVYPATVVSVSSPTSANLTVQLDGPDTWWVTSVAEAPEPAEGEARQAGRWFWPPRV